MNPVLLLGGLSVVSLLIFFQLYRHPETALLLLSLPSPEAFSLQSPLPGHHALPAGSGGNGQSAPSRLRCPYPSFTPCSGRSRGSCGRRPSSTVPIEARFRSGTSPDLPPWRTSRSSRTASAGFYRRLPEAADLSFHQAHGDPGRERASRGRPPRVSSSKIEGPLEGPGCLVHIGFFVLPSGQPFPQEDLPSDVGVDGGRLLHSAPKSDPLDLVSSLLKVQKLNGPAASWFFDPTTERAKQLLGQPATISLPLKRPSSRLVLLVITAFIALVPVKKSVSSLFIDHDKTCALRSGHM